MKIVLASTSPYRKALLDRLGLPYDCNSPDIDESALEQEDVIAMVKRLAELKARAVAGRHENALVIGSDQTAVLKGRVLTKPGNFETAVKQLEDASGEHIDFQTGLCVLNTRTGHAQVDCVTYSVVFRQLSRRMIENYLKREEPYNCAGSFKSEGLGIALFERFEGDDPNALIGLPLIRLNEFLLREGVDILS